MRRPRADSPQFTRWLRQTLTRKQLLDLPENDVEALRPFAVSRTYLSGATLFAQGEPAEELFIVEKGDFELVYKTRFDRLVVQMVHPGSSMGELAGLLGTPYAHSAVALSDATVLCLRLDTIQTLEELCPGFSLRWLRFLGHALERAHGRVVELAGKSAVEQVAHFLLHESFERDELTIEVTQGELAATLALSRQTVSRALRDLSYGHAIERERRRIRIVDRARLGSLLPR